MPKAKSNDPFKPSLTLLIKLGSMIVHYQEFLSPTGHPIDKQEAENLAGQPDVQEWFAQMNKQAFLPLKR